MEAIPQFATSQTSTFRAFLIEVFER